MLHCGSLHHEVVDDGGINRLEVQNGVDDVLHVVNEVALISGWHQVISEDPTQELDSRPALKMGKFPLPLCELATKTLDPLGLLGNCQLGDGE